MPGLQPVMYGEQENELRGTKWYRLTEEGTLYSRSMTQLEKSWQYSPGGLRDATDSASASFIEGLAQWKKRNRSVTIR